MILPLCFRRVVSLGFCGRGFAVAMRIAIIEVLLHPEGWGLIPEVIFFEESASLHKRTS